jgi:hypothetical protein
MLVMDSETRQDFRAAEEYTGSAPKEKKTLLRRFLTNPKTKTVTAAIIGLAALTQVLKEPPKASANQNDQVDNSKIELVTFPNPDLLDPDDKPSAWGRILATSAEPNC